MKQLLLITLFFAFIGKPYAQTPPTGKFLIISDIHFNPFCYPDVVQQLTKTNYTGWQSVFESSTNKTYGNYSADTYYELFISGLKAMQAQNPHPDMIIINGDFLSHEFGSAYVNTTHDFSQDSLKPFINNTISFVFMMLEKHFPNTPVLPVLGNNDDYCGDYHIQPNGDFLSFFGKQVQPLLDDMVQYDFMNTFSKGGYYKVSMPWDSTNVFIALNTIFYSNSYSNCNASDTSNPGWEEMAWLEKTLARCAARGQKVWLSYHIPPGMDIYKSSKMPCGTGAEGMWRQDYNDAFIALVNKYRRTIKGNFAGHTHMDEFRLFSDSNGTTSYIHITPAISPLFGNNPAFVEVTWKPDRMRLLNSVTYRFGGLEPGGSDTWKAEYNYGQTYGIKSITTKNLTKLWTKMGTDPSYQTDYSKYYFVNNPGKHITPWRSFWCGARYLTLAEFTDCNCK